MSRDSCPSGATVTKQMENENQIPVERKCKSHLYWEWAIWLTVATSGMTKHDNSYQMKSLSQTLWQIYKKPFNNLDDSKALSVACNRCAVIPTSIVNMRGGQGEFSKNFKIGKHSNGDSSVRRSFNPTQEKALDFIKLCQWRKR